MEKKNMRLSRPLYEALPWLYALGGAAGLLISYVQREQAWTGIFALAGLAFLIAGIVILLRRRDYRSLSEQYAHSDSLTSDE